MTEIKEEAKHILTKIHKMFEYEPLYTQIPLRDFTEALHTLYNTLQEERDRLSEGLSKGKWVQVLEHQRRPFYAKVEQVLDEFGLSETIIPKVDVCFGLGTIEICKYGEMNRTCGRPSSRTTRANAMHVTQGSESECLCSSSFVSL